jgi:hypothetical protein
VCGGGGSFLLLVWLSFLIPCWSLISDWSFISDWVLYVSKWKIQNGCLMGSLAIPTSMISLHEPSIALSLCLVFVSCLCVLSLCLVFVSCLCVY